MRAFPELEYHDAGASSIRATAVSLFSSNATGHPARCGQRRYYDFAAGGTELDRRLRELIKAFNAMNMRDIRRDKRRTVKMWQETGRIKAILATVKSLVWISLFKDHLTREDALRNAGLSLESITSVVLTGGSTRFMIYAASVRAAAREQQIALMSTPTIGRTASCLRCRQLSRPDTRGYTLRRALKEGKAGTQSRSLLDHALEIQDEAPFPLPVLSHLLDATAAFAHFSTFLERGTMVAPIYDVTLEMRCLKRGYDALYLLERANDADLLEGFWIERVSNP
ncbi:hypothetical protein B0H12DRAFT_1328574 [Mycena haematopus]|nr:hypothetical protein B0H12DRAFT_1328574 [Mycena haematopus]